MQENQASEIKPEYAEIVAGELTRAYLPDQDAASEFMTRCMIDHAAEIPGMTTGDRNRLFVQEAFRAGAAAMFNMLSPVIDLAKLEQIAPAAGE